MTKTFSDRKNHGFPTRRIAQIRYIKFKISKSRTSKDFILFAIHPVPKGVRLSCSKIVSLLNNDEPVESIKFNAAVVLRSK
ncbi:MAG: hypothetical protein WCF06_01320 [Nitrososphaeraceae archaeon]